MRWTQRDYVWEAAPIGGVEVIQTSARRGRRLEGGDVAAHKAAKALKLVREVASSEVGREARDVEDSPVHYLGVSDLGEKVTTEADGCVDVIRRERDVDGEESGSKSESGGEEWIKVW
jgi:hypothetical protein